jgi:YYY domain-containing protein
MFFEWIGREGGAMLGWWVLSLLAGAAVYPLIFRLLGALPSRGYALARAAGLMLVGYVYWLLNNLGLLRNSPGSTVLAWLLVLGMSAFAYFAWRDREPILPWLRRNLALVVTTEALFAVMFFGWALVRALNPDLTGTEKPMEMAFLTSIRRSATFPPNDPWLSGYAISYYHFGYIMMGTLANLSGVTSGIAFNLSVSLLFGLTGVGGFGVAYDLVASRARGTAPNGTSTEHEAENVPPRSGRRSQALTAGILAAVMLLVMGNLGAGMEMAYNTRNTSPAFLSWMDLRYRPADLSGCAPSGNADPASWGCGWWFWAYSRLVNDRDLANKSYEIITEVPQFSFILSDMHPHVLSLPFAILVLGLGLSLVLGRRRLQPWEFLIYAIFTGGMVFLNSWDAVFLVILLGAALRRHRQRHGRYTRQTGLAWPVLARGCWP